MKYPVGFKFIPRGKVKREATVIDYLTTRNLAGEIVQTRYVTEHDFMGQKVINREVFQATIDLGEHVEELGNNGEPIKNINPEVDEDQVEVERLSHEHE